MATMKDSKQYCNLKTKDMTRCDMSCPGHVTHTGFFQVFLDTIPSPLFFKDANGIYQGCNEAFAKNILGVSKERIKNASVHDLPESIPPDLADIYHQKDLELIRNPGIQNYESQVRCADGLRHDFILNKSTVINKDGTIIGMVGVMQDITELKFSEKALRKREEHLRQIVEGNSIPHLCH